MRIDRRNNPAYRELPEEAKTRGNTDLTGNAGLGPESPESVTERKISPPAGRSCPPSSAFDELGHGDDGFLGGLARLFNSVRRSLRDIKQGNTKTFD